MTEQNNPLTNTVESFSDRKLIEDTEKIVYGNRVRKTVLSTESLISNQTLPAVPKSTSSPNDTVKVSPLAIQNIIDSQRNQSA